MYVFLAVLLVCALGLVGGGVAVVRRSRSERRRRVRVTAVVVEHTFAVRPAFVTFDYPVPGGWRRARRAVGTPVASRPGERITVWVDPGDPSDVSLGTSGAGDLLGPVMIVAGAVGVVLVLGFGVLVAVLDRAG